MWEKIIIDGYETRYSVSDSGEVRNDIRNKKMTLGKQNGYLVVGLSVNKKPVRKRVHRLVAEAFIPNPENKPQVNHIDGNRENNNISNLEWVTASENAIHAHATGLVGNQKMRAVRQYNLNGEYMMTYESATEAARQVGAYQSKITDVCKGNRRTAAEYQWRYDDENIEKLPAVPRPSCSRKKVAQYDKNGNCLGIYESFKEAAKVVDGTSSAISRICSGTPGLHTHKGFVWKLVEDIVQEEIDK